MNEAGITKSMVLGGLPFNIPRSGEKNYRRVRELPWGEECLVTRKRDGLSCSFYYFLEEDKFGVLSRSAELRMSSLNRFTEHLSQYNLPTKIKNYCVREGKSLCFRGESFGGRCRNHPVNVDSKGVSRWELFGIWDIHSRRPILINEDGNFLSAAEETKISHVPIIGRGKPLSKELVDHYENDPLGFEGVVIHCAGRTFKILNKPYYNALKITTQL
jgi:hypothetical protein